MNYQLKEPVLYSIHAITEANRMISLANQHNVFLQIMPFKFKNILCIKIAKIKQLSLEVNM